jgi:hypothetical protein
VRAPRFPLNLNVRYRQVGQSSWQTGRTENISRSGVLVRTEESVNVDAEVELRVELPPTPSEKKESAQIVCHGRVVRTVSESEGWLEPGYAVAIDDYDFIPPAAEFLTE